MTIRVRTSAANFSAHWDMGFHEHPDVEMSTVFEGKGQFWHGSLCIPVSTGSVVVIPSNVPHRYNSSTGIRFGILHADGLPEPLLNEFHRLQKNKQPEVLHLSRSDVRLYESMFRDWLRSVSQNNNNRNHATLEAWLRLLFSFVRDQSRVSEFPLTLESAADYIRSNIYRDIHMDDVAKQFGMSVSTFRRLFRNSYGMAPKQYYQMCRLEEATWLLRTTDRSIQEVAMAVGFESLHGFSAWFRDLTGLPPTEWRRAEQNGRNEKLGGLS